MKKSISALAIVAMLSTVTIGTFTSTDAEARARSGSFSSRSFSAPRPPSKPAPAPKKAAPAPKKAENTDKNQGTRLGQSRIIKPVSVTKPVKPIGMNKPATPVNMNKPATPVNMNKPAAVVGGVAAAATVATVANANPVTKPTAAVATPSTPVSAQPINGRMTPVVATPVANGMARPVVATPVANGMARPVVATPVANGMARPVVATPVANGMARPVVATPVVNGMAPRTVSTNMGQNSYRPATHVTNNVYHNAGSSGMSSSTGMLLGLGGGLLLSDMLSNDALASDATQVAEVAALKAQLLAIEAQQQAQQIAGNGNTVFSAAMPTGTLSSQALLESMIIKHKAALFMTQGVEWHDVPNPTSFDQIAFIQYKSLVAAQKAHAEIFGISKTQEEAVRATGMIGAAAKGIYENASTALHQQ